MSAEPDLDTRQVPAVSGLLSRSALDLRKDMLVGSGLFLFAFALYLLPAVFSRPLDESPELRTALVAREMLKTGDYAVPRIDGEVQLQRPPLQYWIASGAGQVLSGPDGASPRVLTRAVQLPSAVFAALAVFIVVMYGSAAYGRPAGTIAGIFLALAMLVVSYAQQGFGDTLLMFFCAASLCCAGWLVAHQRPGFFCALGLGLALGCALLTRLLFPLILVLAPVLIEVVIRRSFNGRKVGLFALAMAVAACVVVPWLNTVEQHAPGSAGMLLNNAVASLNPGADDAPSNRWFFYIYHLLGDSTPWMLVLLPAIAVLAWTRSNDDELYSALERFSSESGRFQLIAFFAGFAVLYAAGHQRIQYLLPLMPPLALVAGRTLAKLRISGGEGEERMAWTQVVIGVLVALVMVSIPFWAPQMLPADSAKGFLELLNEPYTLPILISLAVGVLVLFLYSARQWVEGRPVAAVACIGIVAYAAQAGWSVYNVRSERRKVPLLTEAHKISDQIQLAGSDARVYVFEINEMQARFWLNRPVHVMRDLAAEDAGRTGAFAPTRVIVVPVDKTDALKANFGIEADSSSPSPTGKLRVITLSRETDWPALLKARPPVMK